MKINRFAPANFVRVELRARRGEPDATGARVTAEFAGRPIVRYVVRGGGFFSQSDSRLIFSAAADAVQVDVTVQWPGRSQETFRGLTTRESHLLVEGRGTSARDP
jgi:hypothetical protein